MFPLPSSAQKATGSHCHPSHYTLYQGQISVVNKGFRCRLFLSEYEYWVFSEVALLNCCDPVCPTARWWRRKLHLLVERRFCGLWRGTVLWQQRSQCGLGKTTACRETALVIEWFKMSLCSTVCLCLPVFYSLIEKCFKMLAFLYSIRIFSQCPCLQKKSFWSRPNEWAKLLMTTC